MQMQIEGFNLDKHKMMSSSSVQLLDAMMMPFSYSCNGDLKFAHNFIVIRIGLVGVWLAIGHLSIGHQFRRKDRSTWEVVGGSA
jgi:hypothetical protein